MLLHVYSIAFTDVCRLRSRIWTSRYHALERVFPLHPHVSFNCSNQTENCVHARMRRLHHSRPYKHPEPSQTFSQAFKSPVVVIKTSAATEETWHSSLIVGMYRISLRRRSILGASHAQAPSMTALMRPSATRPSSLRPNSSRGGARLIPKFSGHGVTTQQGL
jgi:hypothetical protein